MGSSSKFDAIIVLAHQMDSMGVLNHESKARANLAAKLMTDHNISNIVVCGWNYRSDTIITIADSFKGYLVESLSMDPSKIYVNRKSRDTVGDAIFTKLDFASPLKWRNLIVVTSNYHTFRTLKIFNFIFGPYFSLEIYGSHADSSKQLLDHERQSLTSFRDTFKGIGRGNTEEILFRLVNKHPFYNGEVFPKLLIY